MKIATLMTQPVLRVDLESTVQSAVEIMGRERIGALIVTRKGNDIGIVTERDIITKALAAKHDLDEMRVNEIMSKPLVTVELDTTGEEALRTMVEHDVRRLPVIENEQIVGIFTTSDVTNLAQ
jgi:CBS domain-containing protein